MLKKYSKQTFESAVLHLIPAMKDELYLGHLYMINKVAQLHFIADWGKQEDYKTQLAYSVVKAFAAEMKEHGYLTFGDIDLPEFCEATFSLK